MIVTDVRPYPDRPPASTSYLSDAGMTPSGSPAGHDGYAALQLEQDLARRAVREQAGGPGGVPGVPGGSGSAAKAETSIQAIDVTALGTNLIIPGAQGWRIAVYQLQLWNVAENTIRFMDGSLDIIGPLVDFPAVSGYLLAHQDEPHFVMRQGESFGLNLSSATRVTGFVKFRMLEKWGGS